MDIWSYGKNQGTNEAEDTPAPLNNNNKQQQQNMVDVPLNFQWYLILKQTTNQTMQTVDYQTVQWCVQCGIEQFIFSVITSA